MLTKVCTVKAMVFHSHVWMWDLYHKKSWVLKYWCFQTVMLEKILENPLNWKEIKSVNPKGNQPWIFIERTDAEAPILRPPDVKSWLIERNPDSGKDWRQEEETTEDKMVGWHYLLDGYEFEHALGVGDGQGSLVCCVQSMGSQLQSDMTERLNWLTDFPTGNHKTVFYFGDSVL